MSSTGSISEPVSPAVALAPAIGVVEMVHAELRELLRREGEIRRRLRALQQTLSGLQQGVGEEIRGTGSSAGQVALSPQRTGLTQLRVGDSPSPEHSLRLDHTPSRLKRACRIALMEAGGSASAEEVHARILRRGSFSFRDTEHAVVAVERMLGSLLRQRRRKKPAGWRPGIS